MYLRVEREAPTITCQNRDYIQLEPESKEEVGAYVEVEGVDGGVAHPLHLHRTYEAAEVAFYVPHAAQADDATLVKFVTEGNNRK